MTLLGALDNFYLTKGEQEQSPSRRDGITAAAERELRHYCADVVAEAAVLLRLPQVVAATAQVLVQRFYCKRSLKKFDPKVVAMAAFWLAAKLEEVIEIDNPNRLTLRDVIRVVDRVTRRREGKSLTVMDPYSQRYDVLKQEAVQTERHMLRAFGFVVHVEHPHRFILNYCQMVLFDTAKHAVSKEHQRAVQQEAWNMANDSLRTSLCVTYRAEAVACGIIFTAARKLKIPLPENPPWWHLFEVEDEQVYDVCATLCELYSRPRPQPGAGAPPPAAAASSQGAPAGGTPQLARLSAEQLHPACCATEATIATAVVAEDALRSLWQLLQHDVAAVRGHLPVASHIGRPMPHLQPGLS
ncbi:Cyclin-L1-1 isoform A [Chlorella sorokiniana]|uniref:Cyclin-L1-1 isoform A n=1 Tax=Chlorella sorokiniana TaxID=3076 RepID=A0A2P6TIX7_CHLSO|nr:Cyclin-L1-1 isoform A [Chlorella sorokiniana]|eukprot:PRW39204.1 Cyclin-L1-1 isoform A [Chlorella sorokiniana]